jgi:hypothetical protein
MNHIAQWSRLTNSVLLDLQQSIVNDARKMEDSNSINYTGSIKYEGGWYSINYTGGTVWLQSVNYDQMT